METIQTPIDQHLRPQVNSDKTYFTETYGCQMNVADSELVESILVDQGYVSSIHPNTADVIFINTCSIREHAEDKVHSQLGRFELIKKNRPNVIIGVFLARQTSSNFMVCGSTPFVQSITIRAQSTAVRTL